MKTFCVCVSQVETNVKLEECLKKVQQENEDYKARMDKHAALSKYVLLQGGRGVVWFPPSSLGFLPPFPSRFLPPFPSRFLPLLVSLLSLFPPSSPLSGFLPPLLAVRLMLDVNGPSQ